MTVDRYVNLDTTFEQRGYSQAAVVRPGGTRIVVAGCSSPDPGPIDAQCQQIWSIIGGVLDDAGATFRDIVRIRAYVTDPSYIGPVRDARIAALGQPPYPPHTFLVVSGLAMPHKLVELEVEAVVHANTAPSLPTTAPRV